MKLLRKIIFVFILDLFKLEVYNVDMNILKSKRIDYSNATLPKTSKLFSNALRISLPAAMETFFIGLIGMVDTIMVGRFSDKALAAIAISQQPVMITLAASMGINAGIIAIISRRKGENKKAEANHTLRQSLILSSIVSIIITVLALTFSKPLLQFAGAKSDTIDLAQNYFNIVSLGLIFNYLRLSITSAQRSIGNTHITLITNVIANLVNIVLNYLLITGNFGFPRLGVAGAAIATVIGNMVALMISVISIYNRKGFLSIKITDDWKPDVEAYKHIFEVAKGAFIEQLFMRIGFFIIAKIVNDLGTNEAATNAIISTVMGISFNITDGFAIGASTLVGNSLGEKNEAKAFAYGRISQILAVFIALIMMSVTIVFRIPLANLFTTEKHIVSEAGKLLLYTSIIMLPQSIQWVTTGVLRGSGDTKYTARSSLISIVFVRPVIAYVLCYPIGLGLIGSWMGMFVDQNLRLILNNKRFTSLKWMEIKV
ncbi:MAG: MATE family efflux transporter [Bacilli bacterium]